jgi:hypothetical protein
MLQRRPSLPTCYKIGTEFRGITGNGVEDTKQEERSFDEQARSKRVTEARRNPRFRLEVDVTVKSPTLGLIPGMSVEMSDSGMSAVARRSACRGGSEFAHQPPTWASEPTSRRAK